MDQPTMMATRSVATDTRSLVSYFPLPGYGVLPINAFVIDAAEPVLVDTGIAALREDFMASLRAALPLETLRWIWLTHTDPDHVGNLAAVLAEAPNARVVSTFLGMGKLALSQVLLNRVYLLNPGQRLNVGDRELLAIAPPCFDAPETTGLLDTRNGTLFSADCFGALLEAPAESAADVAPGALREGLVTWATVDAPWLQLADEWRFGKALQTVRDLNPTAVLSNHLPAAPGGMTEQLLKDLDAARSAPRFMGPDQAAMEQAMAAQSAA